MLFVSVKIEFESRNTMFLIAFGIGLFSVLISFISSLFAYFNIPSIEKCSNPMYGHFKKYFNDLNNKYRDQNLEFVFHMQIKMLDIIKN